MGSGYPSDQKTMDFIRRWVGEHGTYPDFVRKSWKTAKRIRSEVLGSQGRLESHFL
jgi:ribonuclease HII